MRNALGPKIFGKPELSEMVNSRVSWASAAFK